MLLCLYISHEQEMYKITTKKNNMAGHERAILLLLNNSVLLTVAVCMFNI